MACEALNYCPNCQFHASCKISTKSISHVNLSGIFWSRKIPRFNTQNENSIAGNIPVHFFSHSWNIIKMFWETMRRPDYVVFISHVSRMYFIWMNHKASFLCNNSFHSQAISPDVRCCLFLSFRHNYLCSWTKKKTIFIMVIFFLYMCTPGKDLVFF